MYRVIRIYITNPTQIIIKYPNPDNNDIITYIDEASNCYKYELKADVQLIKHK